MTNQTDQEYWEALHETLHNALKLLPRPTEPKVYAYPDLDDKWKESLQIERAEEESWEDTREIIRFFCEKHEWPKRSKGLARFFVEKRLSWAVTVTRLFNVEYHKTGKVFFPRPKESGYELFAWLLLDAYESKNPPTPPTPFTVYTDGKKSVHYS